MSPLPGLDFCVCEPGVALRSTPGYGMVAAPPLVELRRVSNFKSGSKCRGHFTFLESTSKPDANGLNT